MAGSRLCPFSSGSGFTDPGAAIRKKVVERYLDCGK
jgi:hypothetical protein